MSLANKYRPTTFDTTIGQEHITDILKSKIKNSQQDNHNYLFFGPRGTGKTSVARILSKAMNCLDLQDGNPCNKCANCMVINEGKTLDYVEIDAASHTGVDDVRGDILSKVDYKPTQLKKKIYVIDEVHMLSKSAFNALLKTIEEPKDYISFILATTEIAKVPETIISRCQIFNFKKISSEKMINRLQDICTKEGLGYEDEALKLIERISEGCARDAIKYIDQVSVFGDVTLYNVTNFLGIVGDSVIKDFLDIVKLGDRTEIFDKVDEIHNQGIDLAQFARQGIMYLDHNLTDDIDFYLSIGEVFGEILSMIKYYPYPNMVYKIVLNNFLNGGVDLETKTINPKIKAKDDKKEKVEIQKIDLPKSGEKSVEKIETQAQAKNFDGEIDDKLFSIIGDKIEGKVLQNGLKNFIHVKSVEGSNISLIVIDKMTEGAMKMENNRKLIEQKILEMTGKSYSVDISYMDKDEYFSNMML